MFQLVAEKREAFDKDRALEELRRSESETAKKIEGIRNEYERLLEEERKRVEELRKTLAHAEYMSAEKVVFGCGLVGFLPGIVH